MDWTPAGVREREEDQRRLDRQRSKRIFNYMGSAIVKQQNV